MVLLVGNLTRDPEIRYTPKGLAIGNVSLAVNRKWRSEAGEEKEEVTFVECDVFGKQAEVLGQWVRKGSPILINGRLRLDQWDDKQTGQKRSKLKVVIEGFQFLNSGKREDGGEAPAPRASGPRPGSVPKTADGDADGPPQDGDDVPF